MSVCAGVIMVVALCFVRSSSSSEHHPKKAPHHGTTHTSVWDEHDCTKRQRGRKTPRDGGALRDAVRRRRGAACDALRRDQIVRSTNVPSPSSRSGYHSTLLRQPLPGSRVVWPSLARGLQGRPQTHRSLQGWRETTRARRAVRQEDPLELDVLQRADFKAIQPRTTTSSATCVGAVAALCALKPHLPSAASQSL